ncbi:MAG: efflux transporter periplasmic adaptor subunit [Comamonadaceae bacterium CG1_02_60_18]|nr:MAG: efflux transporter periplasmic adaptor subunit [Comamonadaceae bacterium CG1_02_60_18]
MGLTIASAVLLSGCSRPTAPPEPVRAVKVITVGAAPLTSQIEYTGEVRARHESRLGFRVGGKLMQRSVDVGQRVRAGQLLAQLDATDLRLGADAARAQVAAARTNRDLADADFQRFAALRAQNFISAAELQRRRAALDAAQAQLDAAQAQLAALQNQSGYASLLADAAGVVTTVLAEPGQVLAAGTPVLQLAHDGARDVVFAVPEDKVGALAVGSAVQMRSWPDGQSSVAHVREVAASADPVTRTFTVRATLPAGVAPPLGSTVAVVPQSVQRAGAPLIKLPTSALRQEGQTTAVWVLEAGSMTVRSQAVQVLTADGNDVVIGTGLVPGMQVVTAGVHVLAPGQKVTLYVPKLPLAQSNKAQAAMESKASVGPSGAVSTASTAPAAQ